MKKQESLKKLEVIEEALERMACSLASISGTLDNVYIELMKEKLEEERLKSESIKKEEKVWLNREDKP